MVNWESSADRGRGRRPPTRGRGQRSAHYADTKPAPLREKTPTREAAPAPAPAPRGSPIARKLARHSSPWTTLTVPQMAVQVRSRPPTFPDLQYPLPAYFTCSRIQSPARPRPGTAISPRGKHVSRAGSPAFWVPCLSAPPSGCRLKPGLQPRQVQLTHNVARHMWAQAENFISASHGQSVSNRSADSTLPLVLLRTQEGETTLGIAHLHCCSGRSYSGQIQLTADTYVNAIHCNGRHPSFDNDGQLAIWMMTNAPLVQPEDFKILIK